MSRCWKFPILAVMNDILIVLCTFPDMTKARETGTALMESQLAVCVNLIRAVESIYRWEGRVETSAEVFALFTPPPLPGPASNPSSANCIPTTCRKSSRSNRSRWRKAMRGGWVLCEATYRNTLTNQLRRLV